MKSVIKWKIIIYKIIYRRFVFLIAVLINSCLPDGTLNASNATGSTIASAANQVSMVKSMNKTPYTAVAVNVIAPPATAQQIQTANSVVVNTALPSATHSLLSQGRSQSVVSDSAAAAAAVLQMAAMGSGEVGTTSFSSIVVSCNVWFV